MTKFLKQEEKQLMADLSHHVSAESVRSLIWDNSDILDACPEGGETVTILRRSVPDDFWLGFRQLVKLGVAKDTSSAALSDEYDQTVEVNRTVLEALLLMLVRLVEALLCKDRDEPETKPRGSRHLALGEGLEP